MGRKFVVTCEYKLLVECDSEQIANDIADWRKPYLHGFGFGSDGTYTYDIDEKSFTVVSVKERKEVINVRDMRRCAMRDDILQAKRV